jgi:hypothetical protein
MTTDVAVRTESQQLTVLTNEQLQYISTTEFVPPGLRGNLPAILACVATGRALGIADMTALRSIHIIDGKATFSAELMVMLARQRGHSIQGSVTEGAANVVGKRADNGDTMTVEWTLAMAERAGLLSKQNWRKYPEAMLWARAVSQLCRELFPDCFAGATYTLEELGAEETTEKGEPTVDLYDPDIPFGDAPVPEQQPPPITGPQKKKLNVLVGKLRPSMVSTEDLWQHVRRKPLLSDNGELHWSPLRDTLSKSEASDLIEWLEALSSSSGGPNDPVSGHDEQQPGQATETAPSKVVPPSDSGVEVASPDDEISVLTAELVGASRKPAEAAASIERHRLTQRPDEHYGWLLEQKAKLAARGGDAA